MSSKPGHSSRRWHTRFGSTLGAVDTRCCRHSALITCSIHPGTLTYEVMIEACLLNAAAYNVRLRLASKETQTWIGFLHPNETVSWISSQANVIVARGLHDGDPLSFLSK